MNDLSEGEKFADRCCRLHFTDTACRRLLTASSLYGMALAHETASTSKYHAVSARACRK